MQNISKVIFMKRLNLLQKYLLYKVKSSGFMSVKIEDNIIYFKDICGHYVVFSPLNRSSVYFIREDSRILKRAFSKNDTIYRVYADGTMSLVLKN